VKYTEAEKIDLDFSSYMIVYLTTRTMTTQMINLYDISPPPMVDWIPHPDPKVGVVDNGVWRYKTDEEQHKEKMTDSLGYIKYDMEGAQDGEYVAEVGNCGSCDIELDHLRDGTTEDGHRCSDCYWTETLGYIPNDFFLTKDLSRDEPSEIFTNKMISELTEEELEKEAAPYMRLFGL